jgi:hypothetical protein
LIVAISDFSPGLIGAAKQDISFVRTTSRTTVAANWFSVFDVAGNPGGGVLAGTSTTTGVVPTDLTAGCPIINPFGGSATGYLAQVDFGSSVACRLKLFDMLWKAGAYAFNASTTGNTPTSYASRVPGGTDFNNTQIWLEQVTAGTGIQNVAVTYTNGAGTAGRTTGTVATAANIVGRMWQLPLQAGDSGVQGVTGVVGSVATAGTFNILVLRPLWSGRVKSINDGDAHGPDITLMTQVYADSALFMAVSTDGVGTGQPEMEIIIANG